MDRLERTQPQTGGVHIPRFSDFLALILRNKWFLIVSALAGILIAVIYTLNVPAVYERTAMALKISKGVVAKYVGLSKAAGLDWSQVEAMTEFWSPDQSMSVLQ